MATGLAPGSAAAYCANWPHPDEQVHDTPQRSTDHFRPPRPHLTIEHVAAMFQIKVDTAREYSYRADFPPASSALGCCGIANRSWSGFAPPTGGKLWEQTAGRDLTSRQHPT